MVGIGSILVGVVIVGSAVVAYASASECSMRCVNPFLSKGAAFGCGQCMPCRVQRRRLWTFRIMLEAGEHDFSTFVTLTYSEDRLPPDGSLYPEHFRDWLKRLRKRVAPRRLRFYGVGEYGSRTERPHYHAALFGYPPCFTPIAARQLKEGCPCPACSGVRETWGFGHVMLSALDQVHAQYLAKYVTKKMTRTDDVRLHGRWPEFSRMSLVPGIGADAMWSVASEMMRYPDRYATCDVPVVLNVGKNKTMPLGRYLRNKLRIYTGREAKAPESALQFSANQMQIVRRFAWENNRSVRSVFEEINGPYENLLLKRLEARQINETL